MDILTKAFKQRRRIRAYKHVFKTVEGEIVLHDLIRSFRVLKPISIESVQKAAYQEGQRSVVLAIMSLMEIDEAALAKEIEKAKNKRRTK